MRTLAALALAGALAPAAPASAFEQSFDAPAFVVSVPRLPNDGGLAVDVRTRASGDAGIARSCAGTALREISARRDMPSRDNIYRVPLDTSTFLVLYLLEAQGGRQLHAHLLAAVQGTHCVDAHFMRPLRPGEDIDGWRSAFAGASVRAGR